MPPLAFAVAFQAEMLPWQTLLRGTPIPTTQASGTSTDHIITPDSTAHITEDFENQTIIVMDETG